MQSKIVWPFFVVLGILVGASIPLLFEPGYYYIDDTQAGAFGQWYEIGRRVLEGDWSLINPLVWQSGNYLAEGAWGIFSPLLWVVGIGAHLTTDALIFSTTIKIACLVLGGLGLYALARNFGALRAWAALVAVAAPLSGFTIYMDAPSWVNGLMAWSLLPLAWVLIRRSVFSAKSPLLAIAASVSLVGIGYAHATIFLALTIAATIVEALLARHRSSIVRAFAIAFAAGFFAIIVHLPGVLTSPVTGRANFVANTDLLTVNLSGLMASSTPIGTPSIRFFDSGFPDAPLLYIAWFLPLLAFVDMDKLRELLRLRLSLVIIGIAALIGVLLPSDFGPLRFPVRMMPYLTMSVLLILAIGLSHARPAILHRSRFLFAAGLVLVGAGLTFSAGPQYVKILAACTAVILVAIWVAWLMLGDRTLPFLGSDSSGPLKGRVVATASALGIALTVALLLPQHISSPTSPLPDYGIAGEVSDYQERFAKAEGDVLITGGASRSDDAEAWKDTLVGNLWYVTEADVQNAYSAVYYPPYSSVTCMQYNGSTCGDLYQRLFDPLPETDTTLVDLLGVSTVQIVKDVVPRRDWITVPEGWSIVQDDELTRLIVRDEPVAGAGSVVWRSEGTSVTVLSEDAMGVSFRVDEAPADGGTVALSRLPWPGYEVDGGAVTAEPIENFLLGVDFDASQVGQTITVSYWSPGWPMQAFAAVSLLLIAFGWPIVRLLGRRRSSVGRGGRFGRFARGSRVVCAELATEVAS